MTLSGPKQGGLRQLTLTANRPQFSVPACFGKETDLNAP